MRIGPLLVLFLTSMGAGPGAAVIYTSGSYDQAHIFKSRAEADVAAEQALRGNGDLAMALSIYTDANGDHAASKRWFDLAFQYGSPTAVQYTASVLINSHEYCKILHGIYLYKKFFEAERRRPVLTKRVANENMEYVKLWKAELKRAKSEIVKRPRASCVGVDFSVR
jgi:hypothetical protein